jgi:hypothetical protein
MWTTLLVSVLLTIGQAEPAPTKNDFPAAATLGPPSESSSQDQAQQPANDAPAADERWLLMKTLQGTQFGNALAAHKITISGWTDMSFTASSADHSQLPMGFNYRANEFLLQQNWLRIDSPVDTSATTASYGFRSDTILPGSDYRFTLARGIFDSQLTARNGQPAIYGVDPVQFYGEAYFPNVAKGLDIKVGRFFALYGIEAIDAPSNALASHSYLDLYDPFTHTGILATLKLTDTWTVQSGLVLGSDDFIDTVDTPTYIGSLKWAPPKGNDSVLFSVILGCGRFNQAENFHNPEIFDLVYTHKINSKLTYSFESLYGFTTNVPDIGFANWFGILNYLTYDFTSKISGTTRLEFFDDVQGQRTGFPGLYTALTAGLSFKPHRAIIIRPEIRYDVNSESRSFADRHGLFTAASDLILRW